MNEWMNEDFMFTAVYLSTVKAVDALKQNLWTGCTNVVLLLGQRRRQWPVIETALGQRLMFEGRLREDHSNHEVLNQSWVNVLLCCTVVMLF